MQPVHVRKKAHVTIPPDKMRAVRLAIEARKLRWWERFLKWLEER
jgi:hypothetical protein